MTQKDGKTLFEEIGREPSLDAALRNDPRELVDADLEAAVAALRRERAFKLGSKGGS